MGKIAILGAAGHYGTEAVKALLNRNVAPGDMIAIYRNSMESLKNTKLVLRRGGDYAGEEFGPAVLDGAEKLLFISGGGMDGLVRIQDHLAVVKAAKAAGIRHIVYTSIAFPDHACVPFGLGTVHQATEAMIRAAGIPYTFLRNTFYADYYLVPKELQRAVKTGKLISTAQGASINFVLRENMAEAAAAVLTAQGHENKVYTITAEHAYTYRDVAGMLSEASGKPVEYIECAVEQAKAYLDQSGMDQEAQKADTAFVQPAFSGGWASGTTRDMVDLIGRNRYIEPKEIIRKALKA